jgi:CheY-like chemotaxis protein
MPIPGDERIASDTIVVTRRALRVHAASARGVLHRLRDVRLTAPLVAAILVSVAASSAIVVLSLRADASRQAQVKLDDLTSDVIQLQNMPWQLASPSAQTPAQISTAMKALETGSFAQLSSLRRSAYVSELAPLSGLFHTNFALLAVELALLRRHHVTRAQAIDPQRFNSQHRIVDALNKSDRAYHDRAVRSEIEAAVGSGAIILLLLGGFLYFFARAFLARETAEALTGRLRESQEHLEEAQRLTGVGSWEWDFDTQAFICSAEQLRLHGWTEQDTLTSIEALLAAIEPTDRERVRRELVRRFEPGETISLEYQVPGPEGTRLLHLQARTVTNADGAPIGLIGTCQDVSDRFRRLEAERANRAKSEFISRMSHELRTPLNAILGFGQLLRDDDADERRRAANVGRILTAGEHLLGLINELLEIAQIDSGPLKLATEPGRVGEAAREPAPRATDGGFDQGQVVLCIDDNSSNLTLIEQILSMRPAVELLTAERGQQGLEMAMEHRPQLILLDVNLPDVNGDNVLAALRADTRTREIPVFVLSADATPARQQSLIAGGADGYLTKPIDVPELLALVDRILAAGLEQLL